jgi:FdhE protein
MHGTTSSVRPAGRFSGLQVAAAELEPAWRPWVRLLDLALESSDDAEWGRAVPEPSTDRSLGAPLLHGVTLRVDARRVRQLVRELLREARSVQAEATTPDDSASGAWATAAASRAASTSRRRLDAIGVLQGAMTHDAGAIARTAEVAGVDASRLAAVGQLAVIPLLRACATRYHDRIPEGWLHGYCPVCGAWPTLAEIRGLERNRRLRCGRCSTDWPIPVLRCPFCDELHHDKLHALLPEGDEQIRRVDVCETCKGYVKGFSTLRPFGLRDLALADLTTVELDIVAQERGYERPPRPAFPLSVRVIRAGTSRARSS